MMYTEIYPIFTATPSMNIYSEISIRVAKPSRSIQKEMYDKLLKSFDSDEAEDYCEINDRILRFA